MTHPWGETWVDRQIREAQERGEFDNLPGAGKPLTGLGDPHAPHDDDWWVREYLRREGLDLSGALPGPLALRKEAAGFPASLLDVHREVDALEVLEDFNRRVRLDRLRPAVGAMSPILAPTVDVEEVLARWRELRAHADAQRRAEREVRRKAARAASGAASEARSGASGPASGRGVRWRWPWRRAARRGGE